MHSDFNFASWIVPASATAYVMTQYCRCCSVIAEYSYSKGDIRIMNVLSPSITLRNLKNPSVVGNAYKYTTLLNSLPLVGPPRCAAVRPSDRISCMTATVVQTLTRHFPMLDNPHPPSI